MNRLVILVIAFILLITSSVFAQGRRPSVVVSVNPTVVQSGEPAALRWESSNATSVTVGTNGRFYTYRDPLRVPLTGSMIVKPTLTTTYYVIARKRLADLNDNGRSDGIRRSTRASVTVQVK
jgi:hypothetical protein